MISCFERGSVPHHTYVLSCNGSELVPDDHLRLQAMKDDETEVTITFNDKDYVFGHHFMASEAESIGVKTCFHVPEAQR